MSTPRSCTTGRCAEALEVIASLGLTGAEINAGGFLPTPHLPVDELLSGAVSPADYLATSTAPACRSAGLNCNGNPLHPDPEVGPEDADDLRNAIRVAGLLGVDRVVTMSGLPPAHPGGTWPAWHVNTWDSGYLDSLDYQWDEVAVPFWNEIDALARENGVKVAIEMHPQNLVFNPPTLKRLVDKTGATHVGAEMDPSHLFWQGIDPVAAIEWLGPLVFHAAAKDTRINENCKIYGVLDERFTRIPLDQNPTGLGGKHVVNKWPEDSAWDFVAVGQRPRRRLLGALPAGAGEGRPRHGGQHRARGRRVRTTRGPAGRRRDAQGSQLCAGELTPPAVHSEGQARVMPWSASLMRRWPRGTRSFSCASREVGCHVVLRGATLLVAGALFI